MKTSRQHSRLNHPWPGKNIDFLVNPTIPCRGFWVLPGSAPGYEARQMRKLTQRRPPPRRLPQQGFAMANSRGRIHNRGRRRVVRAASVPISSRQPSLFAESACARDEPGGPRSHSCLAINVFSRPRRSRFSLPCRAAIYRSGEKGTINKVPHFLCPWSVT